MVKECEKEALDLLRVFAGVCDARWDGATAARHNAEATWHWAVRQYAALLESNPGCAELRAPSFVGWGNVSIRYASYGIAEAEEWLAGKPAREAAAAARAAEEAEREAKRPPPIDLMELYLKGK